MLANNRLTCCDNLWRYVRNILFYIQIYHDLRNIDKCGIFDFYFVIKNVYCL